MKSKTSSKKIGLLGCALVALSVFAPAVGEAIVLDNPFPTVAAPQSGTTIVDFSGTATLEPNFQFCLDCFGVTPPSRDPFDPLRSNTLEVTVTDEFLAFLNIPAQPFPQNFTGLIFDVSVPAGTPPGFYAFSEFGTGFQAEINLVSFLDDIDAIVDITNFGVLVTPIPDRGSSILLLGLSLATLCCIQRAFVSRA